MRRVRESLLDWLVASDALLVKVIGPVTMAEAVTVLDTLRVSVIENVGA